MRKTVFLTACTLLPLATSAQSILSKDGKEMNIQLDEVVVTGTGTQHLLKDAPVQTEVIGGKQLAHYGGKNIQDILSGLTASLDFNEGDMGSQMQLNGLGNSYILVMVNGKRLHGDVGGQNDLGLIDPHDIEKIEIVKGASSALYGSDAIAGVINIITKKHNEEGFALENTTRYASHNDIRQHNGLSFSLGKVQSYTNFQLQHTDGWQNTPDEYTEGTLVHDSRNMTVNKYTNWQISEHLTYTPTKNISLYLDGANYYKDIMRPRNGRYASCDVYTYDLNYHNASISGGGTFKLNGTDVITVDVDWNKHAYFYKYFATTLEDGYDPNGKFTNYYPYFDGDMNLQSDQQRTMAQAKGVFYLPASNILSAGVEFRYDYLDAPTRVKGGTASDWTGALYVQDEFNMLNWLNITAGLRLNQNKAFGFKATPKISGMVSAGDFRFRLGWSQGFKTPTPKELSYHYLRQMGGTTYYYMGNSNLDAQTSNYGSVGVEYRGKKLTVSVTGYLNSLDNMITLVNVPVSEIPIDDHTSQFMGDGSGKVIPRQYKNMETAKTYGADVNISYKLTKELTLSGNYSYLDTQAEVYNDSHHRLDKVTIDGMAHHKWNANITWGHRFSKTYQLGIGLYGRGSSKRYYQNDGDGKAYQLWRLNTSHDFGKSKHMTYRVEAGVDNIFNFVDTTPRHLHLGTTSSGTTLYASIALKFSQGKRLRNSYNTNKLNKNEED